MRAASSDSRPTDEPAFAWLLGLLALPWLAHAWLVLASGLHLAPLAGRLPALVALGAALAGAWGLGRRARPPSAAAPAADAASPLAAQLRAPLTALGVAAGLACAYPLITAALLPITAYDAIAYRLPTIAQWLDAGRIAWVSSDDPVRNGYPLGQEAMSALIAAASGSLRFAATTSYPYLAAAALAIYWLARRVGVRRAIARAAAAGYLLTPMLILNAPSGYVDAAFASACVCLFCGASLCVTAAEPTSLLLLATGMAAAHVLALKGTGLPFVLLVVGLCGVRLLLARRAPSLRALGAFALGAAPGLFWPLRNLVHTGNPLWPIRVSFGGKELLPGVGTAEQILDVAANTPAALAAHAPFTRVLLTWLQWRGPALDFDYRLSGLGYAWLLLALPALLALLWRYAREPASRPRLSPVAFVLLLTAACFALQPMAWWSRYTLWLWGAGALAIACLLEALLERGARGLRLLAWAWAALALGEAGYTLAHVHGLHRAVQRYAHPAPGAERAGFLQGLDLQHARQAKRWIAPEFWPLGLTRDASVCRGWWKPRTDNPNLDGVLAQLSPRPRMHVVLDERGATWVQTRQAWRDAGCPALLLFRGSPVLPAAQGDPDVSVRPIRAFDPLYLVRWRPAAKN